MMHLISLIQSGVMEVVNELYGVSLAPDDLTISPTRKEFTGDYTLVVFPFTRFVKKKPEDIGNELGSALLGKVAYLQGYNVIKGFLNLELSDQFWKDFLGAVYAKENFGFLPKNGHKVLVESCSPNTNKPLHLGHIRNILLGWSMYKILDAAGYDVVRVQIINDRGIAVCKSMLAWQKFGQGATPESEGVKGDHFVGDYYVRFDKAFKEEYSQWQKTPEAEQVFESGKQNGQSHEEFFKAYKDTYFNEYSALGREARDMLLRWEAGDPETVALWKQMNSWVYQGFDTTYQALGVEFDKFYFESDTYLLGKDTVEKGLKSGIFYRLDDGSVWIDLEDAKLDKKLVLRKDGTSVYITQDIGTAQLRFRDFGVEKMVYVVADEQNYHFQVLFEIMKRLGEPYAEGLFHLSYGMVELPTGRMKSREGTVVDADDLLAEVVREARENTLERETIAGLPEAEQEEVIRKIALAALKFFLIKVHPKKRMIFDPKESVDLQGQTGPYVQNAYVRVQSVLRRIESEDLSAASAHEPLNADERDLIGQVYQFPGIIQEAAREYDPSAIANYCFTLAKSYHRFYHEHSILRAENEAARAFRLQLSMAVAHVLRNGMDLLGIDMPERM
ncbi:MAG: Arginine--tRNA ligase [Haliscomenobacter sp.]|jgi:arginyl-tRNA synthetase|nr:Arginine--tRNA ligase [Haliscomenobacter sp.]